MKTNHREAPAEGAIGDSKHKDRQAGQATWLHKEIIIFLYSRSLSNNWWAFRWPIESFVLTDDGRVIKAVNKKRSDQIETVIIEDLVVFEDKSPITKLALYRHSGVRQAEHLIVVTENEIRKLPLHRCHLHKDCR